MVDLSQPDHSINISKLNAPYDLVRFCKRNKIEHYCYAFYVNVPVHNSMLLFNIGMSEGGRIGDRIYRKVGNLPGWGLQTLLGEFGSDMKSVVDQTEKKFQNFGLKIHKDDVILELWNTTNLISHTFSSATIEAEKKLIEDCEQTYGCTPAGNIQDPRTRNKQKVLRSVFNNLFFTMN